MYETIFLIAIAGITGFAIGLVAESYWPFSNPGCRYFSGPLLGCRGPCGCAHRKELPRLLAFKEEIDRLIASCATGNYSSGMHISKTPQEERLPAPKC